jgi:hypothetical protein
MSSQQIRHGIMTGTIASGVCDTGATSSVGTTHDHFLPTISPSTKTLMLPTGGTATAMHTTKLALRVRAPANSIDIVPDLRQTLISGSKFADAGYTAVYDRDSVNFYDEDTIRIDAPAVLRGYRCPRTGLWRIPLQQFVINDNTDTLVLDAPCGTQPTNTRYKVPTTEAIKHLLQSSNTRESDTLYNVYELPTIGQSIRYLHAAAGFPTKSTWLKAIRHGNYSTWPLISVKNVNKYFPESEETQQGHMKNQRQGVRSTKQPPQAITQCPTPTDQTIFLKTYDTQNTIYTDQTGKFPHFSSRGNRYQMILYHVATNSIWVEAMRNKTEGELILARARALQRMAACGIKPTKQVLDNETSASYKHAIINSDMSYQLVPPDDHRRNLAEKAIQTWKDHFIAALSGTADKFPLHLWCQTLPQMERQLNLLRQSHTNPKISAYAQLYGHHDYNALPFVPIGMEALVHDKPSRRSSFAQHCTKGWVLGTSPEHYRCYKVWSNTSRATRISATVFFKHKYITNPTVTPADAIIAAAANLAHTLNNNIHAQHLNNSNLADLKRLQQILTAAATSHSLHPAVPSTPSILTQNISANEPRVCTTSLPRQPRSIPAPMVSDYDSDSSDDDSIDDCHGTQTPKPTAQSPRVSTFTSAPAFNTRSKQRSITQETILHNINFAANPFTPQKAAHRNYPFGVLNAVLDKESGELMEYKHLVANPKYRTIWTQAYGKELGRLAQGLPNIVDGTDTIKFIHKHDVPTERFKDVTYGRLVTSFRPEKEDPYRVRLTVGGNRIHFPGDCGTPTVDMLTVKILLNSVISTKGAKFMTIDIKDFYLCTPMERPEFMRLKLADMPEDVITHYKLRVLQTPDGYVYVRIQKGMYGLPQAGIIAQKLLEKRLNAQGYRQSTITPGFWRHDWRPISFTLCVDDFGVKYIGTEHAKHLLQTINAHYNTSHDWQGERYLGLTISWNYPQQLVHLSMPNYCNKAIQRFHHTKPHRPQDQPYPHSPRIYGLQSQLVADTDTSPPLNKQDKTFVQEVIGVLLYYARAVDCTMLPALGSLATQQANPTQHTLAKVHQLLDYAATHPDAMITYRASDMVLAAHSDASYLSESKARSRAGGHFFLSENDVFPTNNGAILTLAQIIKHVMSSAAEAELGALYINAREAIPQRHLLIEMGHPQPPTPIQIDNSTALGVVTNTIQPKRTKAMDMRFHWLRCRTNQQQFRTHWRAGSTNLADYVTKHHPAIHHRAVRPLYLTSNAAFRALQHKSSVPKPTPLLPCPLTTTLIPIAGAA